MSDGERERLEFLRAAFEARPDYQDLIAQAAERGFRRITLYEQMNPGSVDAYEAVTNRPVRVIAWEQIKP